MTERNLHQDMTEAERRISNVALMGQVVALDTARARVRVQAGPITTGWLPFATVRAGLDRTWHPPEPGEQVLLVAPGGDLNQGVVVGSIYRAEHHRQRQPIETRPQFRQQQIDLLAHGALRKAAPMAARHCAWRDGERNSGKAAKSITSARSMGLTGR